VPKISPLLFPSLAPIYPLGIRITSITSKQKINQEKQRGFSPVPQGGKISFSPPFQLLVIDLDLYLTHRSRAPDMVVPIPTNPQNSVGSSHIGVQVHISKSLGPERQRYDIRFKNVPTYGSLLCIAIATTSRLFDTHGEVV
jgi:hypothetical protein